MGRRQAPSARREPATSPVPSPTRRKKLLLAITVALLTLWVILLVTVAVMF